MKILIPFRLGAIALAALLLASCAQQRIRDNANERLRRADYEQAVSALQNGVADYPESALLRAGLAQARAEAVARLIAQALQERAEGRFDDADKSLRRATKLDPNNQRLAALRSDFEQARRTQKNLTDARTLLSQGKRDAALKSVETGLLSAPRNSELLSLQRQIELEQRLAGSSVRQLAEGRPISLDFRAAPLSSLLEAITRGSGINFILDRDVKLDNRTTIYMKAGRADDALDLVLGANQLAKRIIDSQTVLIYPNTPDKQREHQELVIRVFHLAHVEAKTAAQMLRSLLKVKEPYVDEKANMVALREPPEIIALAERLMVLHDVGEAEVMLEVEVMEIKTSRLTELGISFPNTFSLTPLPAGGGTGLTIDSLRGINSSRVGVGVAGLLVNLRREVGDFNTLANPKVRVKSKEKAKILIGDKVPVITTTNSGASGLVSENISYLDVGLKLDVEPTVSPDDEVTIKLGLEVSSIAREIRSAGGSTAFQIGTRNANTVLRLLDGETQILAGLISNEDRASANRVPGLGDLPLAGRLFSSQKDEFQRTELVLAVTPRIVRPAPRPTIAQAEMWIGSEANTRLRPAPQGNSSAGLDLGRSSSAAPIQQQAALASASGTNAPVASAPRAAAANPAASASLPDTVQMRWQAPKEVKVGESFSAVIEAVSGAELRGLPMELTFPQDLLEVVSIAEEGFLKQGDSATSFVQAVNTAAGRINVGLMRNESAGARGEGAVVSIQFRAKATGSAQLRFNSVRPIGSSGMVPVQALPTASISVK
jgi:general secretion pathway protein D